MARTVTREAMNSSSSCHTHLQFPFKGCALHCKRLPSAPTLCNYINSHHYHQVPSLPNKCYHSLTLYPCRKCSEVFHDPKELAAHTCGAHTSKRTETNLDIICRHLLTLDKDEWADALPFLQARLTIKPPGFRPNEFLDLDPVGSDLSTSAKSQLINIFLDSTLPLRSKEPALIYE